MHAGALQGEGAARLAAAEERHAEEMRGADNHIGELDLQVGTESALTVLDLFLSPAYFARFFLYELNECIVLGGVQHASAQS